MYPSLHIILYSHKEKADRSWLTYRLLEDSFISEVFMGQLKSTLQCSVCKGASVTFDPFWDICLPIPPPKKKKVHVCVSHASLSLSHSCTTLLLDIYIPVYATDDLYLFFGLERVMVVNIMWYFMNDVTLVCIRMATQAAFPSQLT